MWHGVGRLHEEPSKHQAFSDASPADGELKTINITNEIKDHREQKYKHTFGFTSIKHILDEWMNEFIVKYIFVTLNPLHYFILSVNQQATGFRYCINLRPIACLKGTQGLKWTHVKTSYKWHIDNNTYQCTLHCYKTTHIWYSTTKRVSCITTTVWVDKVLCQRYFFCLIYIQYLWGSIEWITAEILSRLTSGLHF